MSTKGPRVDPADTVLPRYPVYIPSKGRYHNPMTVTFLHKRDGVPVRVVVEPQEYDHYAAAVGAENLLVTPHANQGLTVTRNWIKAHATAEGHERHWQIDDNIDTMYRMINRQPVPCRGGIALRVTEDFVDRYTNVAVAGLNYQTFVTRGGKILPPFYLNCHVYSCTLILNALPFGWTPYYNEDVDICLRALSNGWCTVAMNAFVARKCATLTMRGGQADLYKHGDGRPAGAPTDGRLAMARSLARDWPHVVSVRRRFRRAQHVVRGAWRGFDTKLIRKPEYADLPAGPNEYGMVLHTPKDYGL